MTTLQDLIGALIDTPRTQTVQSVKRGYQGSDPDIQGEWDKYNAGAKARDAARGFTPTTRMPSGGGTGGTTQKPTGPRGGGAEGQRTRPPAPPSPAKPSLSQIIAELALSPYQGISVTGRTRRPTPEIPLRGEDAFGRFLENLVTNSFRF